MTIEVTGLGINAGAAAPKASNTGSGDFSAVMEKTALESRIDLDTIFARAAEKYGVSVDLLKAVAKAESNFNPDATSACGAMGIMQLMPGTATGLGVTDAYDPVQNIMGGAKFLSQLLKRFDGNTTLAVAAYNAGPNNVIKYDGIPPFKETQNYVRKVLGYLGDRIIAGSVASGSPAADPSDGLSGQSVIDASGQANLGYLLENALLTGVLGDDLGFLGSMGSDSGDMTDSLLTTVYQLQLQMMRDQDDDENVIV
ncbi:MAG: lytic transglycosylase domain-containing protein [Clostridiales bacterium]|nr:lytic transglycosylase domain-containing protein [Clostridiales bacterium]